MAAETVRAYDFATKRVTTIPAAELAEGMVRARVEGIEGEVYVQVHQLRQSDYRNAPFDEEKKALMREFAALFADVYPATADDWEDGFRRDVHMDREIGAWRGIAKAYST
jgi:hypothetical protein